MTKYVILRFIKYASRGFWEYDGFAFTNQQFTLEEAQESLKKFHHNGEIQYCKESLCSDEHWWKDVLWAIDYENGYGLPYTMSQYLKDLQESGEWDKMTKEQHSLMLKCSM